MTGQMHALKAKGRTINNLGGGLRQRLRVEFFVFLANRLMSFFSWPTG